jgi:transcriptional regulator with XRE-family HTH domain
VPREDEIPTIGRTVARYRKLAKLSAETLAAEAGEGLTRSVVANLENGRKRDVTVAQWLAISRVLDVPPSALLVDYETPNAAPDFALPPRRAMVWDSRTGIGSERDQPKVTAAALSWLHGESRGDERDRPASAASYGLLQTINSWRRAQARLVRTVLDIRSERESGADDDELIELAEICSSEADGVADWLRIMERYGADISGEIKALGRTMRRAGISWSEPNWAELELDV